MKEEEEEEDEEILLSPTLPDIYVQLLFHVFAANIFFGFVAIFVSIIPFHNHHLAYMQTIHGAMGAGVAFVCAYLLLFLGAWHGGTRVISTSYILLSLSTGLLIGFLNNLLEYPTLAQFLMVSCVQSFAIVIYTYISPRSVALMPVWITMFFFSAPVCYFLVAKMENPTLNGALIVAALLLSFYNLYYIHVGKMRYDATWRNKLIALARYYCEIPMLLCGK